GGDHADGGDGEAGAEADLVDHHLADQRGEQGAEVDAHVEDVVGPVLQLAPFGVEVPDQGRDVGLEEAVADHQADQGGVDGLDGVDGEERIPHHENRAADQHRVAVAQVPVGDPAADQRA